MLSAPGAAPGSGQEVTLAVGGREGEGTGGDPAQGPSSPIGGQTQDGEAIAGHRRSPRPPVVKGPVVRTTATTVKGRPAAAAPAKRRTTTTTTSTASLSNANSEAAARITAASAARAAPALSSPPTAPPPPPPATTPPAPSPSDIAWDRLAQCESSNTNDGGSPYYGYWQFSADTWHRMGETGLPNDFSREHQLEVAKRLQAASGWSQWPDCARRLGLR